jgi:tRNA G18 (ribose-2'-O)-methylase SpoU
MIISVDYVADPRLDPFRWKDRQLASRLDRLEAVGAGLFVAEGDLVVERALHHGCQPIALLCDSDMAKVFSARVNDSVEIFTATEDFRREITGLGVPLRATGLFRRPPLRSPDDLLSRCTRVVVAEAVDNPTNLGAIIRSAAALGWDGILLLAGSADPLARRALRVSMGAGLMLPFARLGHDDSLDALFLRHECTSYALTPDAAAPNINDIDIRGVTRMALMLGSERDGLTTHTLSTAHQQVRIPMHAEIDSLNVGAAAAIAMQLLGPNALH